jgi:hypothetical protein
MKTPDNGNSVIVFLNSFTMNLPVHVNCDRDESFPVYPFRRFMAREVSGLARGVNSKDMQIQII